MRHFSLLARLLLDFTVVLICLSSTYIVLASLNVVICLSVGCITLPVSRTSIMVMVLCLFQAVFNVCCHAVLFHLDLAVLLVVLMSLGCIG